MLSSKRAKALINTYIAQLYRIVDGAYRTEILRYSDKMFTLGFSVNPDGDDYNVADSLGRQIVRARSTDFYCMAVNFRQLPNRLFRVEATYEYGSFNLANAAKEFDKALTGILSDFQSHPASIVKIERNPGVTRTILSLQGVTSGTRVADIQCAITNALQSEEVFSETQFDGFWTAGAAFHTKTDWENVVVPEPVVANNNRLPLDEAYLQMAEIWGRRSKSNRAQVGALIVKGSQIISDGYNGLPNGHEPDVCETRNPDGSLTTKSDVLHAESNAIAKLARHGGTGSDGATIYVNLSPCEQCAKLIVQAGIKRVVYRDAYRSQAGIEKLVNAGIEVTHIPKEAK